LLAVLTVNTTADQNVANNDLSLREALLFSSSSLGRAMTDGERAKCIGVTFVGFPNAWSAVGGVGTAVADSIVFENQVGVIAPSSQLPDLYGGDTIDGLRTSGAKVILSGLSAGSVSGLVMSAANATGIAVRNLVIRNFASDGIHAEHPRNNVFQGLEIYGNGGDGILITNFDNGASSSTRGTTGSAAKGPARRTTSTATAATGSRSPPRPMATVNY
jgi:CSLREA domain-containing protein